MQYDTDLHCSFTLVLHAHAIKNTRKINTIFHSHSCDNNFINIQLRYSLTWFSLTWFEIRYEIWRYVIWIQHSIYWSWKYHVIYPPLTFVFNKYYFLGFWWSKIQTFLWGGGGGGDYTHSMTSYTHINPCHKFCTQWGAGRVIPWESKQNIYLCDCTISRSLNELQMNFAKQNTISMFLLRINKHFGSFVWINAWSWMSTFFIKSRLESPKSEIAVKCLRLYIWWIYVSRLILFLKRTLGLSIISGHQ